MSKGEFLFIGTGGSMGVPVIACKCEVCRSTDSHNKRYRSSALVTIGTKKFLIDAGPDFRSQALQYSIDAVDGVIMTHAHQDHTGGIDDLRVYCFGGRGPIPCLLSAPTLKDLQGRFGYIFTNKRDPQVVITNLDTQLLPEKRGEVTFQGVRIGYFTFMQAGMEVNGFRFGDLAYVSDISKYPETLFEDLRGVRQLVISALRFTASAMHFSVDDAVAFSKKVGAEHTWLMHTAHDLDYEKTNAYLPPNVRMAYDGLQIDFDPFRINS